MLSFSSTNDCNPNLRFLCVEIYGLDATENTYVVVLVKEFWFDICGHLVAICHSDMILLWLIVCDNRGIMVYDLCRFLWLGLVVATPRLVFFMGSLVVMVPSALIVTPMVVVL